MCDISCYLIEQVECVTHLLHSFDITFLHPKFTNGKNFNKVDSVPNHLTFRTKGPKGKENACSDPTAAVAGWNWNRKASLLMDSIAQPRSSGEELLNK